MGPWNLYFICKIALHAGGSIALHPGFNLGLVALVLAPLPGPAWRIPRQVAAIAAGIALLYYESFLPPFRSLLGEAGAVSGFSFEYLAELLARVVEPRLVVWLLVLFAAYLLLTRWLRISAFVLLALLIVPFLPLQRSAGVATATGSAAPASTSPYARVDDGARLTAATDPAELNRAVERFFAREERKTLAFPQVTQDLDLILIHICSLAWDDLQAIGQDRHPLFSRFDVLFTNFNTAASYSGPAAIRLLRGTCGQEPHDALYDPAAPDCQLMVRLQQAGFRPQLLLNHDGHFGNFRQDLAERGGLEAVPQPTGAARVVMQSFDGTPITEDYDTLHDWWQRRRASKDPRIALYYNTVSLHDGNRLPDAAGGWLRSYPRRATKLLDDIDRFIGDLEASGSRAVVVFIPEHGAAFHSTPGQIAGLRQVPGANVTRVPVGVRLVGLPLKAAPRPLRVETSTSYLGLNQFLANVMATVESNPGRVELPPLVGQLHMTPFVAEHDGLMVVRAGQGYYTRGPDRRWSH